MKKEWPVVALSHLIEEKPKNGYSGSPVDYVTTTKVLSLSATTKGVMDLNCFKYLDEEISADASCRCRNGDIYLQRGNTKELVGTAALFDTDEPDFIYPDLMIRIRANEEKILSKYLLLSLQSGPVRRYVTSHAVGAAGSMPKINQAIVEGIPIVVPPLDEQQKVVEQVEREMRLVSANRELMSCFEAKIKAVIERVWEA